MRKSYFVLILLISIFLLLGCTNKTNSNTLIYGALVDPSSLNPLIAGDSACNEVQSLIFSTLVKVDDKLNIIPDLAEKWQVKNGGREYIFSLRPHVQWQDEKAFTADDVKFTFATILSPQSACNLANEFQNIKEIKVKDEQIIFDLEKPDAAFLSRVAQVYILPSHLLSKEKNIRESSFNNKPIGTGPYRLVERKKDQYLHFTANPFYYQGQAKIKDFYYKIVPDVRVLSLQLQKGEIDLAQLEGKSYQRLKDDANLQFICLPGQAYTFIALNNKNPLFTDSRVRKALCLGHDRQRVIATLLLGHAYQAKADLPPQSWGYNDEVGALIYSPQKAASLLADAGWQKGEQGILQKGGQKFSFTLLLASNNQKNKDLALAFQEDMRKLGIDVRVQMMDFNVLREKHLLTHNFTACLMSQRLGPDPDNRYSSWHSAGAFNFAGYANKRVDALLEQGQETLEKKKRAVVYKQLQAVLLEDQPFLFHNYPQLIIGAKKNIEGISHAGMGAKDNIFWNVEKWEKN